MRTALPGAGEKTTKPNRNVVQAGHLLCLSTRKNMPFLDGPIRTTVARRPGAREQVSLSGIGGNDEPGQRCIVERENVREGGPTTLPSLCVAYTLCTFLPLSLE